MIRRMMKCGRTLALIVPLFVGAAFLLSACEKGNDFEEAGEELDEGLDEMGDDLEDMGDE